MNDDMDSIAQQLQQSDGQTITERLDQISMFLQFIQTNRPQDMIVGKEKSVGHIKEEHMGGHIRMDQAILTLLNAGQIRTAIKMIYSHLSEFKMTMSIDGEFINNVTKQELRYTHTQHLYPHEPPQKKGGWLGGKPKGDL